MRTIATLACALAVAVAGCGQGSEPADEPTPEPDGPLVVYERGGGVAGVIEALAIEADGSASLTVGVEQQVHEFRLREAELERLEQELAAADFDAVEKAPADTLCADCFEYTVEHEDEALTINDLDQPAPPLQTLLGHLSVIVADNYPPGVSPVQSGA